MQRQSTGKTETGEAGEVCWNRSHARQEKVQGVVITCISPWLFTLYCSVSLLCHAARLICWI